MKISYYNIGCKVNFAEIASIQKKLEDKGHSTVDFGTTEEAVIINTCSVTNNADSDARKIIRRALKNNPSAFIGVLGCYAQLKPGEVADIDGVDAVFGMKEKFDVIDYLDNFSKKSKTEVLVSNLDDLPFHTASTIDNENRTRMILKLQDGCDYSCTYCTIPQARGASRSMAFNDVVNKFNEIKDSDFYEVVLSGVNLGEYSVPSGEKFLDVIKYIDNAGIKQRIRISSIEPNLIKHQLIDIVKQSNTICSHFHIPLQSGSPEILKQMKRRYNSDFFQDLILKIKTEIPDCCIGLDVISGFPGETDELFLETYNFIEKLPVSYLHAFTYSERTGTPAVNLSGKVLGDIRKARTLALRRLSESKKEQFYLSQLGNVARVIPEDFNQLTNTWKGWTDNYVRVEFEADEDISIEPVIVQLLSLSDGIVLSKII